MVLMVKTNLIDIEKIKSAKSTADLLKFSIINIDKPSGPTSFQVSQFVKNILNLSKTSHAGTLDPMVSGVLPVMLSRACRLSDYLMHRDKKYVGIMRLHKDITDKELKNIIKKFIGKITQLPPVRSRVKRAERIREVKTFNVLEREGNDVLFETQVQAGTYIRKICDDMGKEIGGAHMLELRRTEAGIFKEPSVNLYDIDHAVNEYKNGNEKPLRNMLIPGEIVSQVLPVVFIKKECIKKLYTGSPIFSDFLLIPQSLKKDEKIAVFSGDIFVGCYRVVNEGSIVAVPEFVLN
ncbi:MAG TPA: RNA-guided pseudouridylation complex pseudouridine synthase subunit Cbf5 [Candidatus Nanoarchaeia archaeon]|nr:RNA-guided pseudouridylation complex pseudouridine synthase subunit Cbf5 [Candidatus Nanoarchaeia archaeon]